MNILLTRYFIYIS